MLCQGNRGAVEWQVSAAAVQTLNYLPAESVSRDRLQFWVIHAPPPPPYAVLPGLTQLPPCVSPTRIFLCFDFQSLPDPFPVVEEINMVDR